MTKEKTIPPITLKEKIAYCSGKDFWHTKSIPAYRIPEIMMADGPHGLRKQENSADMLGINESVKATCFPTAVATSCSFDVDLIGQMAKAIAKEAKNNEVSIVLGPGVNIKRNPLCGRNFEYFSEDPYLAGKLGQAFVKAVQGEGIGTSVKHFALNNQEYKRFLSDSILDERTMREIYLSAFEEVIKKGKPDTVMCAYNKINGTYCSENKWLLTDVLRKEWGFDGVVVTDWGAMSNRIKSFQAGCDLSMPGGAAYMEAEALEAVKSKELSENDIDASVARILKLVNEKAPVIENREKLKNKQKEEILNHHHELAVKVAEESAVLLKNTDCILPVKMSDVGFIGYMAENIRYQGAGSSHINPWKLQSVTELCKEVPYAKGCDCYGQTTEELLKDAVDLAKKVKVPVVFAGLPEAYESEGFDREHMKMPKGHLDMIEAVTNANSNTVVVIFAGSVVEMPFYPKVKAILYMGLPGQGGAKATLNLLLGECNPCGKLAETWPIRYEDCICSDYYGQKNAEYREGIYVGYRYYLSADIPVQFPFGYGLSYTEYEYSSLKVEGNTVSCIVTNMGNVAGKEIVQLYVEPKNNQAYRPKRELKGFKKVELNPGESKTIFFELDDRSFSIWQNDWVIPKGEYDICIAKNSLEICLRETVFKDGVEVTYNHLPDWYINPNDSIGQNEFEEYLGRKIEEPKVIKGQYTMQNTVMEMKDEAFVMKMIFFVIETMMAKKFGGKKDYRNPSFKMMVLMAADCSLSGMKINSGMKNYLIEGMLEIANGHFFKGIAKMMKRVK